ncbi:MAG TPA: hypothetical protein VIQ27_03425 [Gemmatimonadales bacterium]|jgi:hypothetical protein
MTRQPSLRDLTAGILLALSLACDPPSPVEPSSAPADPTLATTPTTFALAATLVAIGDPNVVPSKASGSLRVALALAVGDPNIYEIRWDGAVRNPKKETFVRGDICFIGDPSILPSEQQAELASLGLIGDPNLATRFTFGGGGRISDRLAAVMIEDPDEFVATLFTLEHPNGAIAGALTPVRAK